MLQRRLLLLLLVVSSGCSSKPPAQPAQPSQPPLPKASRLFAVPKAGGAADLLLGVDGNVLWAVDPEDASGRVLWRVEGPGVVQLAAAGDAGQGHEIYVAWGRGRGYLQAPLVLQAIDPASGKAREVWRNVGERNDATHLSVADVDRDGAADLAFVYFHSKYLPQSQHFTRAGAAKPGVPLRMATSWAYGDLNGDGVADEAIGRIYGDGIDAPGDLRVGLGQGAIPVPTEKGVRAMTIARTTDKEPAALYFADGWVANYGRDAKAFLKRAVWRGDKLEVEELGRNADEYSFGELMALDIDGDGTREILAWGNKRVTVFEPGASTPWASRPLCDDPGALASVPVRRADGRVDFFTPGEQGTRLVDLSRR